MTLERVTNNDHVFYIDTETGVMFAGDGLSLFKDKTNVLFKARVEVAEISDLIVNKKACVYYNHEGREHRLYTGNLHDLDTVMHCVHPMWSPRYEAIPKRESDPDREA